MLYVLLMIFTGPIGVILYWTIARPALARNAERRPRTGLRMSTVGIIVGAAGMLALRPVILGIIEVLNIGNPDRFGTIGVAGFVMFGLILFGSTVWAFAEPLSDVGPRPTNAPSSLLHDATKVRKLSGKVGWTVVASAVILVAVALGWAVAGGDSNFESTGSIGIVTVSVADDTYVRSGGYCIGSGEYEALEDGAPVLFLDENGETLGTSKLDLGVDDGSSCTFDFAVSVPPDRSSYTVVVANSWQEDFTEGEMKAGPSMWP